MGTDHETPGPSVPDRPRSWPRLVLKGGQPFGTDRPGACYPAVSLLDRSSRITALLFWHVPFPHVPVSSLEETVDLVRLRRCVLMSDVCLALTTIAVIGIRSAHRGPMLTDLAIVLVVAAAVTVLIRYAVGRSQPHPRPSGECRS